MNLNGRSSLDPRWTKHHVPVVRGFMLATVKVIRKLPGVQLTYDQGTGSYSGGFSTIIDNTPARIQPFGIIGDMIVGQEPTGRRLMRAQVESKLTDVNMDDMLVVTLSPDAPELVGFTFEIRGTISSSNAWITDLVCEADLKRQPIPTDNLNDFMFGRGIYGDGVYGE